MDNLKSKLEVLACIAGRSSELVSSCSSDDVQAFEIALRDIICDELVSLASNVKPSDDVLNRNISIGQIKCTNCNINNN